MGELIRLAIPLSFVQLSFQLTSLVDTAMAGRLSDVALAGVGLGSSCFFTATIFGLGICLGLDPIVSQAMGARRSKDARHALWQGIYLSLALSLPTAGVAIVIAENLDIVGVVPGVAEESRVYVWGRLLNIVSLLLMVTLRSYLQAAHLTRPIVVSSILANIVNFFLDIIFGFGDSFWTPWGWPALGIEGWGVVGIAWSSTATGFFQLAILAYAVRTIHVEAEGNNLRAPSWELIRRLLRVGTPIGTQLLAEVGVFALVQVIIATMSATAAAGHQTALMLASMTFSVCLGIGAATSVQVGRSIGQGNLDEARQAGFGGIAVAVAFMCIPSVGMMMVPEFLAGLITKDTEVLAFAVRLLQIAAVFQVVDGIQSVSSGALRGAGITDWSMKAHLFAHWVVGLPIGLGLAFVFDTGAEGLWWGLTIGLGTAAISLGAKFVAISRGPIQALMV